MTAHCLRGRWRPWARAHSGSTSTCRTARSAAATATSTPTCPLRSAPVAIPRAGSTPPGRRSPLPAACSGRNAPPFDTVFFGGGTPTLVAPEALAALIGDARARFRAGCGCRSHHRGQSGERHPPKPRPTARRWDQPDLLRHAERRPPRVGSARSSAHPRPGHRSRRLGAGGRLRADQRRPDLRGTGGA